GKAEFDAAAKPLRVLGVAQDVTARKIAEDESRRREAQLARAEQIAGMGSYEWDVATGALYRSRGLFRIFGLRQAEFEPTLEGYLTRVHPRDRESTKAAIEHAVRERVSFEFEDRIVRPDGAIRLVHSQGKWIFDTRGNPVKLVGICRDITDRKAAEEEL